MELDLIRQIEGRFERLEARLDAVHLDMVEIAGRMDRVIEGMTQIDTRLARLDVRLERVERRAMERVH